MYGATYFNENQQHTSSFLVPRIVHQDEESDANSLVSASLIE